MNAPIRADWLAQRRTGIGGSDAAAILGLSKFATPLSVYLDKRGESPEQPDNASMLWGRLLEPAIRQQYAEQTGRAVLMPAQMLRHPRHDFMVSNLDGFTEDRRVVEVKTARTAHGWGESGTDQVPDAYLMQVQHYMAVTGFPVADVAVLIGGSDFRIYEVPADAELQAMLIEAEAEFWQRVLDGKPPEPQTDADMRVRFGTGQAGSAIEADADILSAIQQLRLLKAEAAAAADAEEAAKATLQRLIGTHESVTLRGKPIATWKAGKPPMRFDAAAFKAAHPDLYPKFLKPGEAVRRFTLKESHDE